MVKRFLLSAAAVAAITGNVIAFDVLTGDPSMPNELDEMEVDIPNTNPGPTALWGAPNSNNTGLIFPAYFVGDGWQSTLKIINTKDVPVIAKVVLFDGKESKEAKDFTIYLSGKDVFEAEIKVDSDGIVKIISTDDSAPLEGTTDMASATNPLKEEVKSYKGYIEVIPMVTFTKDAHGKKLRDAYIDFSEDVRRVDNGNLQLDNGVVKNEMVRVPYVDINESIAASVTGNTQNCYNVDDIPGCDGNFTTDNLAGALTGYIRITDVVNGKDMIMRPASVRFPINSLDGDDLALVYLEGEKATLLDVAIDNNISNNIYDLVEIENTFNNFYQMEKNEVYITYGEAPVNNMYALVHQPFKRITVQQSLWENDMTLINDYWPGASLQNNAVTNYGTLQLVVYIYDNSENEMPVSQFSPAFTPKLQITQELGWTGTDITDSTKLPYYLMQAQSQGFNKGFVILKNSTNELIPGFVTQMLATEAGGNIVTNWIYTSVR